MMRCRLILAMLLMPLAATAQPKRPAPLFDNLGSHHHEVTTTSKLAQRYFDQGLILLYGFNHREAARSFKAVAKLDPDCAMAYWGVAYALGPNINKPMADEDVPAAYQAVQQALKLAPKASKKEQAYIRALAKRYVAKPVKDRSKLDRTYADAMRQVAKQYPDDLDAATLFAEALMDTTPWDYYGKGGKPKPVTDEIFGTLESVLKRNPDHPGANHFYIHAVEASPNPERGLGAAYRLRHLVPGAGHLVHMPAHIFLRVGLYHQASDANVRAIAADEGYITHCRVQGFYPAVYFSHNVHFLWYSMTLEGRSRDSIEAGRKTAAVLSKKDVHAMPFLQWLKAVPLYALVRFGKWDEILKEPKPMTDALYENAMWHYARGMAFVGKRQQAEAEKELAALRLIEGDKDLDKIEMPVFPGASLVRLAAKHLAAEVAGVAGKVNEEIKLLRDAVAMQDKLPYMEPPYWFFPIRQSLGAALLRAGQAKEAETVYREDLKQHPSNGWSLFGLLQSLRMQGRIKEAARVEKQFREAWKYADVVLTGSVF